MFKYRVLTFTIILSMLLFYATPIGSVDVKAEEVTYTQRQLQDVGAWFIGERLLEGAVENFNFDNLPTNVTVDDFLADLGAIIAEGNPDPLIDDLGQAADDIWNGIELELANWTADDAWSLVKDTFYTLWYDVNPPTSFPLADVLIIADGINEQLGVYDRLLQYANTDVPDTYLPQDYIWFQNVNNLFIYGLDCYNTLNWYTPTDGSNFCNCTFFSNSIVTGTNNHHISDSSNQNFVGKILSPLLTFYVTYHSENNDSSKYILEYTSYSNINYNGTAPSSPSQSNRIQVVSGKINPAFVNDVEYTIRTTFPDINTLLNYLYDNFSNFDLYINNILWVKGYTTPVYPIASTDLTYPNYEPAKYNYPEGTSVDWNRLYSIIYNAVRDGIVIDFGDLEDCFVDVNGQTAIATLGLVRNDYDNLVQEQFTMVPYPRFNDNLWLSNLAEEMTEPAQNGVTIIENAYNIFPLPLQKALLFAGALLLFGLLIRRFLE